MGIHTIIHIYMYTTWTERGKDYEKLHSLLHIHVSIYVYPAIPLEAG